MELIFKDEVYAIMGAAMDVHRELGSGFLESVYQEAIEMELTRCKIPFEAQKSVKIIYKGEPFKKEFVADLICYGKIIVEIKATKGLTEIDEAQIIHYLKATRMPVGVLIDFGGKKLDWKRYANTR